MDGGFRKAKHLYGGSSQQIQSQRSWLRADPKKIASPTWRGIKEAKKLIVKGACYLLGDGNSINVWKDQWVPWIEGFKPRPRVEIYS